MFCCLFDQRFRLSLFGHLVYQNGGLYSLFVPVFFIKAKNVRSDIFRYLLKCVQQTSLLEKRQAVTTQRKKQHFTRRSYSKPNQCQVPSIELFQTLCCLRNIVIDDSRIGRFVMWHFLKLFGLLIGEKINNAVRQLTTQNQNKFQKIKRK